MTNVVAQAPPLGKRAFIMSVIEGEGEICDPSNATCATAQIADNSRTIGGGTNPEYYEHIVALLQPAIDAGLTSAFTATGKGCVPQTVDQLAAGLQAALCIRSSDFAVIKDWPVATCNRVPGYGYVDRLRLRPARRSSTAAATTHGVGPPGPDLDRARRDQHLDLGRRRRHGLPGRRRVVGERRQRGFADGHADRGRHADLHAHLRHRRRPGHRVGHARP